MDFKIILLISIMAFACQHKNTQKETVKFKNLNIEVQFELPIQYDTSYICNKESDYDCQQTIGTTFACKKYNCICGYSALLKSTSKIDVIEFAEEKYLTCSQKDFKSLEEYIQMILGIKQEQNSNSTLFSKKEEIHNLKIIEIYHLRNYTKGKIWEVTTFFWFKGTFFTMRLLNAHNDLPTISKNIDQIIESIEITEISE